MPNHTYIIDTGPILALLDKNDTYHSWAKNIFSTLPGPYFTCEPVLTECAYLLRSKLSQYQHKAAIDALFGLLHDEIIVQGFSVFHHYKRVAAQMRQYHPTMDFADACLVAMTELPEYKMARVITVDDRDFSIYRRHGKKTIDIISPSSI